MKSYKLSENVDVIVSLKEYLFLGSYDLRDGGKSGTIRKVEFSDTLQEIKSVMTSGTFDLKIRGNNILAANSKDVTIFDEDLKVVRSTSTGTYNTFITQNESFIIISDGDGDITVYNKELEKTKQLRVSQDTLWVVEIHKDLIYCGGEDGILYILDLQDMSVKESIQIGCGITSLYFDDNFFLVGSYDENIYKFSYDFKILQTSKIGGGVWRILKKESNYVVSCMYDGVKILNDQFKQLETYEKGPLIYSLALVSGAIIFNSFYDRKLYLVY